MKQFIVIWIMSFVSAFIGIEIYVHFFGVFK